MPVWDQLAETWQNPWARAARQVLYAELTEPGTAGAQFEVILSDPQLQRIAAMGLDMLSEEVVWYADARTADFLRLVGSAAAQAPPDPPTQAGDGPSLREAQREAARQVARTLAEQTEPVDLPSFVWAFRVRDVQRAAEQLGKLELLMSLLCWTRPELRGRLGRTRLGNGSYITLALDGRLAAPWVRQRLAALDVPPDDAATIVAGLERLPLVLALGMRRNYVVLSVGPSLDALRTMHGDAARLVDLPEMAPLREAMRARLTSLAYLGPALTAAVPWPAATAGERQPGAVLAYSLWTGRGIEHFTHDWTAAAAWTDVEPLRLLAHAGERPMALAAWRTRVTEARYAAWAERVAAAGRRFDAWLRPQLGQKALRSYRVGLALAKPLGRRGGEALHDMLLPLLEQGQGMLVVDARRCEAGRLTVRPALVLDVSRAHALRAACAELGEVIVEIRSAMADGEPSANLPTDAPGPDAPAALRSEHVYRWGDGDTWSPSLGLSEQVAVAALSPSRAAELLEPRMPQLGGLLAEPRERLSAAYLDWAGLVELARPAVHRWTRSLAAAFSSGPQPHAEANRPKLRPAGSGKRAAGFNRRANNPSAIPVDAAEADAPDGDLLHAQIDTLLDLLQVVHSVSCQQYVADGALVTHRLVELRDVADAD